MESTKIDFIISVRRLVVVVKLTQKGLDKLEAELRELKMVRRPEVIKAIAVARAHGDLKENAEYDAAREAQGHLEARIAELESKLSDVSVIDESRMDKSTAYLGAYVQVTDIKRKKQMKFQLVSKEEADFSAGKISVDSPVGMSLLGMKAGDIVDIAIPAGILQYKIDAISRDEG